MDPLLKVEKITKRFGNLIANNNINFEVQKGEVLAILGENGAGKTTLMNILFGHYTPDSGSVFFNGSDINFGDTGKTIKLGIGMVHQHFTLAENLTVLENIIIGQNSLFSLSLRKKAAREKIKNLSKRFGLPLNLDAFVSDLSVSEKQRLEILKTLFMDCKLLILDEPTAALTPQETDSIFKTVRTMVNSGLSVILISHKLNEILSVSDRILVLRNGSLVGEVETKNAKRKSLAEMIVGKKIIYPKRENAKTRSEYMSLLNVSYLGANEVHVKNINLNMRGGQILGIAGVAGNGQVTLAKLLSGHIKQTDGIIVIDKEEVKNNSPRKFLEKGVAYIPEDRNRDGLVGDMSIWENAVMTETEKPFFKNFFGWINKKNARIRALEICDSYDVRMQSLSQHTRLLSGGNVQKLLVGRWLMRNPQIIIACQPTRGLDEGAIASIQKLLLSARDQGAVIVLISEDLDELLSLTDYISVMFKGQLSTPIQTNNIDRLQVGLMMGGEGFQ